jgi:hypothetical protein
VSYGNEKGKGSSGAGVYVFFAIVIVGYLLFHTCEQRQENEYLRQDIEMMREIGPDLYER